MTLSWLPRKWIETRYIQEVHFTLCAAVWNICFLWLCESVPLSVSCPLLYFLTFVSGVASVLGLGFCFLVSFTVFFAFPLYLCNSESSSRLVSSAFLQEIRLQAVYHSPDSLGSFSHFLLLHPLLDSMFEKWMWTHFHIFPAVLAHTPKYLAQSRCVISCKPPLGWHGIFLFQFSHITNGMSY